MLVKPADGGAVVEENLQLCFRRKTPVIVSMGVKTRHVGLPILEFHDLRRIGRHGVHRLSGVRRDASVYRAIRHDGTDGIRGSIAYSPRIVGHRRRVGARPTCVDWAIPNWRASGPQPTLSRAKFASKRHGNLGSQQQSKGETVGYEQNRHVGSQDKITGT